MCVGYFSCIEWLLGDCWFQFFQFFLSYKRCGRLLELRKLQWNILLYSEKVFGWLQRILVLFLLLPYNNVSIFLQKYLENSKLEFPSESFTITAFTFCCASFKEEGHNVLAPTVSCIYCSKIEMNVSLFLALRSSVVQKFV